MSVSPLHGPRDGESFADFYAYYLPRVLMYVARRYPACDAEDVAAETMTRCWGKFAELDAARDPWGFVCTIACNVAIDSLRRTGRIVTTDDLPEEGSGTDLTYDAVVAREQQRTVRAALARLRPADRQLIEDYELAGMACADMAAVRDISPNALRQKLFRARNRLAVELRRVGAALGSVPVSLQARGARVARRLDDVAAAAGPVGATALSIAALAGMATFGTVLGGVGDSRTGATGTVTGTTLLPPPPPPGPAVPPRPSPAPAASRPANPAPPTATGEPKPSASESQPGKLPVRVVNSGDPTTRRKSTQGAYVTTPWGDEYGVETTGYTPGYGLLCNLGFTEYCPEEES